MLLEWQINSQQVNLKMQFLLLSILTSDCSNLAGLLFHRWKKLRSRGHQFLFSFSNANEHCRLCSVKNIAKFTVIKTQAAQTKNKLAYNSRTYRKKRDLHIDREAGWIQEFTRPSPKASPRYLLLSPGTAHCCITAMENEEKRNKISVLKRKATREYWTKGEKSATGNVCKWCT